MRDLYFKNGDNVFSYRVGGILIHNNKILLQKLKNDEGYAIIGGHVSFLENSIETLKREFKEELHIDIEVNYLVAIGEVFIPLGRGRGHQINLYYNVTLKDSNQIALEGALKGYDELNGQIIDLEFVWIPLEKLKKEIKIYPLNLISIILENKQNPTHFIYTE